MGETQHEPVAIVGIGCRFPGASGPQAFWELLRAGVDSISEVPAHRWSTEALGRLSAEVPEKAISRWGGFIDSVDQFDWRAFRLLPREIKQMDPQHRLLLEVAWEALEDAGLPLDQVAGSRAGIYMGIGWSDYLRLQTRDWSRIDSYTATGNTNAFAANRLSYAFDLKGPSISLDVGCTSSLATLYLACQGLWAGETDLALAGGVNLMLSPDGAIMVSRAGLLSPDGKCKTLDAEANGFVRGEGSGIVVLKRFSQIQPADRVYALIRGISMSHNGHNEWIIAPSQREQEALLRDAYRKAGVDPAEVDYVELHGTGFVRGDAIEAQAVGHVLGGEARGERYCLLGSVKTNIGHLEAAAGVASLIKAALSLYHREIPPTLHVQTLNPAIPFQPLRLEVPRATQPWPEKSGVPTAGVTTLSLTGANAHAVMEAWQAPSDEHGAQKEHALSWRLLPLSARSEEALYAYISSMRDFLLTAPPASWNDICYTAALRRSHHEYRMAIAARTVREAGDLLAAFLRQTSDDVYAPAASKKPSELVFVFAHQDLACPLEASGFLWRIPAFRETVEACEQLHRRLTGQSLLAKPARRVAKGGESARHDPIRQFVGQIALAALWRSWGIEPAAVLGAGAGEIAASYVAGVLSLEEALNIVLACEDGLTTRRHCALPAEMFTLKPASIPLFLTTGLLTGQDQLPAHAHWSPWSRNSAQPAPGLSRPAEDRQNCFLALGTRSSLFVTIDASFGEKEGQSAPCLFSLAPGEEEEAVLLKTAGKLYSLGYACAWQALASNDGRCISLPTYAWQRERIWPDWLDTEEISTSPARWGREARTSRLERTRALETANRSVEDVLVDLWSEVLELEQVSATDSFFEAGGHSLLALQLLARIRAVFQVEISLGDLLQAATPARCALLIAQARNARPSAQEHGSLPGIEPAPDQRYQPFPATDVQEVYWVGRSAAFEIGNVGNHGYAEVECPSLDLERFDQALQKLIKRHEMLRAIMLPDGRQQILEHVPPFQVALVDLQGLGEAATTLELERLRRTMDHEMLPIDKWPSFKIVLSLLDRGRVRVHLSVESLFFDAWSMNLLIHEFLHLYAEPSALLPPLELSFRDYILAEQTYHRSHRYQRDRDYWLKRIPELAPAPELPTLYLENGEPQARFIHRSARLEQKEWRQLKARAARAKLTPSCILLAAFSEVLATWSKSSRFSVNLSTFNRLPLHPQMNEIVGDFTSLLVISVEPAGDETFEARAQRLQARLWQDLDHSSFSGIQVLRELARLQGNMTRAVMPIVFTSLLIQDTASPYPAPWQEMLYCVSQTPQVWLDHQVVESAGALVFHWESVDALFPDGLIDDMFRAYEGLLKRLATEEEPWQSVVLSLTPAEQLEQRAIINATEAPVSDELLHTLFLKQARRIPQQLAVITPAKRLTYRQVYNGALQLGWRLRELAIVPNQLVGIVMEKGWEQIVAALGALLAGGAYLPIDPALPEERLLYLLQHGNVRVVLTQSAIEKKVSFPGHLHSISVDRLDLSRDDVPPLAVVQRPEDLAYVIYTSGSTGLPKGVMIDHRGAVNTILDLNRRFAIGSADRVLALSALNFDLSVYDIFGLLAAGGTVILPAEANSRNPAAWADLLVQEQVTLWNTVPALLQMLVDYAEAFPEALRQTRMRLAFLSGDWIPLPLPERIARLVPGIQVISMGGATEASIWSILYPVGAVDPGWKSIPYGQPMANQHVYVLNEILEPCPTLVPGQLYIGGLGLARGYWRDDEKTRASFFSHPRTGERLYRTGDLGRYLSDGQIEFLGREDFQVKVQGHRIELGEIEETLRRHPLVQDVVANAIAAVNGGHNEKRLVAYVVLSSLAVAQPGTPATNGYTLEQFTGIPAPLQAEALDGRPEQPHAARRLALQFGQASIRREPLKPTIRLLRGTGTEESLALSRRRLSVRVFQQKPITLANFSAFLEVLCQSELEGLPKYRYPSAGGIYPVQIYLLIKDGRISGIAGGFYYYNPEMHRLVFLSEDTYAEAQLHGDINRPIAESSAFSLFLVGKLDQITEQYGAAAHNFCLLEAGYISQLLMTNAPNYQLGLCPIGSLDFAAIRQNFRLDDDHVFLHCLLGGRVDPASFNGWSFLPDDMHQGNSATGQRDNIAALVEQLRAFLRERLPGYMVPSRITVLDALPLTPNGKIDRKQLPLPDLLLVNQERATVAPRSELERVIVSVWQELLPEARVGTQDNFFDLGGNSLLMVRAYTRLKKALNCDISLAEMFFQYPTIQALAEFLSQTQAGIENLEERTEPRGP